MLIMLHKNKMFYLIFFVHFFPVTYIVRAVFSHMGNVTLFSRL